MEKNSRQNPSPIFETFWKIEDVARYTGLSVSYLYNLTSTGQIPHVKTRRKRLIFIPQEITKWFLKEAS